MNNPWGRHPVSALVTPAAWEPGDRPVFLITALVVALGLVRVLASLSLLAAPHFAELWSVAAILLLAGVLLLRQRRCIHRLRAAVVETERAGEAAIELQHHRVLALHRLSRAMAEGSCLQELLDSVTRLCRDAFACEQVSLMLKPIDEDVLEVRSAVGHPQRDAILGVRLPLGEGVAGWVAQRKVSRILGPTLDRDGFQGLRRQRTPPHAAMVVPITVRSELVGVLCLSTRDTAVAYHDRDLETLEVFALNVGLCIRNYELRDWMLDRLHATDRNLGLI